MIEDGCRYCDDLCAFQFGRMNCERCLKCGITNSSINVSLYDAITKGATLINCPKKSIRW